MKIKFQKLIGKHSWTWLTEKVKQNLAKSIIAVVTAAPSKPHSMRTLQA